MTEFKYILGYINQLTDHHRRYLYFDRSGIAYFINRYSRVDFIGELGWYKWKADNNFLNALADYIDSTNIFKAEDYSSKFKKESHAKNFTFKKEGLERSYIFDKNADLPDTFAELEKQYLEVIEKIRAFPWKTLRLTYSPEKDSVFFGDYLNLMIIFQNIGTSTISFANPSSSSSGIIDFSLELTKKDLTVEDISRGYSISLDLRKKEMLITEKKVLSSDTRILNLEQGENLKLKCRIRIPKFTPGEYSIKLIYSSIGNEQDLADQEYLDGEMYTEEKTLFIKKKG